MLTRGTEQHLLAELRGVLARVHAAGITQEAVTAAVTAEYQPAAARLPPDVWNAFLAPTEKANVQVIEQYEADIITWLHGGRGHPANVIDVGSPAQRNPGTLYVRSLDRHEFLRDVPRSRVFLSGTQHNLGADLCEVTSVDDGTVRVTLTQQKVGKTPLHAGMSDKNAGRSMVHIANKMFAVAELMSACFEEEFDLRTTFRYYVDTTSPVRQTARDHAHKRGILVEDAHMLWNNCWPPDLKNALLQKYKTEGWAKGLGQVEH